MKEKKAEPGLLRRNFPRIRRSALAGVVVFLLGLGLLELLVHKTGLSKKEANLILWPPMTLLGYIVERKWAWPERRISQSVSSTAWVLKALVFGVISQTAFIMLVRHYGQPMSLSRLYIASTLAPFSYVISDKLIFAHMSVLTGVVRAFATRTKTAAAEPQLQGNP